MCHRINELRQERCVLLSSPSQRHWEDESWTMTPKSRETCGRFWELFRFIPLAPNNPVEMEGDHRIPHLSRASHDALMHQPAQPSKPWLRNPSFQHHRCHTNIVLVVLALDLQDITPWKV